jgi:broad specificity phosphatase PhoE
MPRLLRTVARTAVIAGTATTVSNRVSRRQAGRWADKDQQQQDQSPPDDQQQQQQYAAPPPAPPADPMQDKLDQLKQLGELKEQGVLSDEEFQQQKAKILNS